MEGKVQTALVTGANRGLGFETARQLANRGCRVLLTSRDEAAGRAAVGRILRDEKQGRVEYHRLDVTDTVSIEALASRLRDQRVSLDILVNNGAVALDGFDERVARKTIDTNFYGPLRVTDALLPLLADGGTIVMVSSGAGELSILSDPLRSRYADPRLTRKSLIELTEKFVEDVRRGRHTAEGWPTSAYGVSKASLNALVRIMAAELAGRRIRINAVCPGWVHTDMGGPGAPRSVAQGAASVLWAALLTANQTGGFFRDGKPIPW